MFTINCPSLVVSSCERDIKLCALGVWQLLTSMLRCKCPWASVQYIPCIPCAHFTYSIMNDCVIGHHFNALCLVYCRLGSFQFHCQHEPQKLCYIEYLFLFAHTNVYSKELSATNTMQLSKREILQHEIVVYSTCHCATGIPLLFPQNLIAP